jgi:hypothetical protein
MTRLGHALRWATAAVVGVVLIGVGVAAFGPRSGDVQLFAGRYAPDDGIIVTNLTVTAGQYLVGYSMRVYVAPNADSVSLVCGVVDTSGRFSALPGLARPVVPGGWITVQAQSEIELPDVTLGIRCFPERPAVLEISVRDAELSAYRGDD